MKRFSRILLFSILTVFLSASVASAIPVSFGDSNKYWPGWSNDTSDDSDDTIGIPDFTGGTADVNKDGRLTNLSFAQATESSSFWSVLSPGDLFIDTDSDESWDYVVDLTSWTTPGPTCSDPGSGWYNIYSVSLALNSQTGYIFSGKDNSGGWSGYLIRDNHPIAAKSIYWVDGPDSSAYGQVSFSGWGSAPASEYTFDFTDLTDGGLALGDAFTIAWAVNCANDVIYETISNPVPEPATMLLLGAGLVGLAGFGRKKFRKS